MEFKLNIKMNRHNLNAIMASLIDPHILDLIELPIESFLGAEDGGLNLANNTSLLIKNNRLNFTSVQNHDTE